MAILGREIMLMLPVSGGAWMCIAGAKSCKLSVKGETIEISSASNSRWKEFIAGREEWEVSTSHLVMSANSIGSYKNLVGTTLQVRFGTASEYISGNAICTQFEVDAATGSLAKGSFRFQGTGPLV